jgi:hypothetical protein
MTTLSICALLLSVCSWAQPAPQARLEQESLTGIIETSSSPDRPIMFVSVDIGGDGIADRGFLVEFETRPATWPSLNGNGSIHWHLNDRLELVFDQPTKVGKRIVLRGKSKRTTLTPPLGKGDLLVSIVAMNRFKFIKPMSHAQLAPLQLKRTALERLP